MNGNSSFDQNPSYDSLLIHFPLVSISLSLSLSPSFSNGTCANTEWTLFNGAVSRSHEDIDWQAWAMTNITGRRCVSYGGFTDREMTLRDAVLRCSEKKCVGISVMKAEDEEWD